MEENSSSVNGVTSSSFGSCVGNGVAPGLHES